MITNTCPSPCNMIYSYTEDDLRWNTSNTICPMCRASLTFQHFQHQFNEDKKQGNIYHLGKNIFRDKNTGEIHESTNKGIWLKSTIL